MLKRNLIANYIGQGWRAFIGLAFIPLYINYLGMESYGLIGVYALLQAILGLLENGLNPALSREMARFTGGGHSTQSIRNLLRSIEVVIAFLAVTVVICVWALSTWLANNWLNSESLPVEVVDQAVAMMGFVIGLRFIENIYSSSMLGLQRQVHQNIVASIMATARGLGAVAILAWVSPTIEAFFLWQAIVSLLTMIWFASIVYQTLPTPQHRARFKVSALAGVWPFAAGMIGITLLSVLLTQIDKILLSKMLDLETFGYYTLATVVAMALFMVTGPISNAFYPRLTQILTRDEDSTILCRTYHQGAQLITVFMGAGAVLLVVFSDRVLFVWTGDANLVEQVAPLLSILAAGALFGGLILMPYLLQLAMGWTSLRIWIDSAILVIFIPAMLWIVPNYGALGAAWILFALNATRILVNIPLMHRRLLKTEQGKWFVQDVALPLIFAFSTALALRLLIPGNSGRLVEAVILISVTLIVLLIVSMLSPLVREQFKKYLIHSGVFGLAVTQGQKTRFISKER